MVCHLQGHEVGRLMQSSNRAGFSNFTYWVPAPPPPSPVPTGSGSVLDSSSSSEEPNPLKVDPLTQKADHALLLACKHVLDLSAPVQSFPLHRTRIKIFLKLR